MKINGYNFHLHPKPVQVKDTSADLFSGDALIAIDHQNMIGTQLNSLRGEGAYFDAQEELINWPSVLGGLKQFFSPVDSMISFADWDRNAVYIDDLARAGVKMVSASDAWEKNVDFKMTTTVSILAAQMKVVKRVILLTHDGDFTSLAESLKDLGLVVIVVGIRNATIAGRLFDVCDAAFKIDPPLPECRMSAYGQLSA
jgi:hypothetical protein